MFLRNINCRVRSLQQKISTSAGSSKQNLYVFAKFIHWNANWYFSVAFDPNSVEFSFCLPIENFDVLNTFESPSKLNYMMDKSNPFLDDRFKLDFKKSTIHRKTVTNISKPHKVWSFFYYKLLPFPYIFLEYIERIQWSVFNRSSPHYAPWKIFNCILFFPLVLIITFEYIRYLGFVFWIRWHLHIPIYKFLWGCVVHCSSLKTHIQLTISKRWRQKKKSISVQ